MSRYDPRHRETRTDPRRSRLNEFFVEGKGINHEVLKKQICRYLGSEAFVKPHTYNGVEGYLVTAVRPLTPDMLDELLELSNAYEKLARDQGEGHLGALAYEEFEACRREEAAFTQSGAEYTSSQCGYQARDPYATASPLPGYPPPHELISDSERSNAGFSPNWSAAGVKCQQDSRWESDATRAVSLSSRTNDLATRRPNPRGRDRQDPRVSQSRENASGSRDPYSSGYTAGYGYPQYTTTTTSSSSSSSSYDAYSTQLTGPVLSSSRQEQARKSNSVTPYYRSKRTPTVESCNKSSSFYNSAMTFGAGLLVGVVAGYAARSAIQSLRR